MVFGLFRRSANQAVIDRLYAAIVAAARRPGLFTGLGMIDTFEGRFESLTFHTALVLRRLNALPAPGPDIAQDLVDTVFRHFDRTLREMGVGDSAVPKRMKGLAEAFLGRSAAYDDALRQGGDKLAEALARNILALGQDIARGRTVPFEPSPYLAPLTRFAQATEAALGTAPAQAFVDGAVPFPDPAPFALEA